jgi:hypothetical protein
LVLEAVKVCLNIVAVQKILFLEKFQIQISKVFCHFHIMNIVVLYLSFTWGRK